MSSVNEKVVFLGNLSYSINKEDLAYNVWLLFKQYLGINVKQKNVSVHDGHYSRYAFVSVHNVNNAQYALDQLSTWESRSELHFNFTLLCDQSQSLKVGNKRGNISKKKPRKWKKKKKPHCVSDGVVPEYGFHSDDTEPTVYSSDNDDDYLPPDLSRILPDFSTKNASRQPMTRSSQVYYEGQKLGNETRSTEFKTGGKGYLDNTLKHDVPKYLTSFLNSGVKGTLYIGVKDDEGTKKVIEISVTTATEIDKLYATKKGEIYIRRDGSVQCLSPAEIQEWVKQKHSQENRRLQSENLKLQEKVRNQEEQLEENMRKITEQESSWLEDQEKLRRQEEELEAKRRKISEQERQLKKKSKVCVIL